MKRFLLLLLVFFFTMGCSDAQKKFCADASTKLCTKCEQCGDFRACGLSRVSSKAECISTLEMICSAYDGVYNRELARSCTSGIDEISCDQLKNSGKPEVCTRLF